MCNRRTIGYTCAHTRTHACTHSHRYLNDIWYLTKTETHSKQPKKNSVLQLTLQEVLDFVDFLVLLVQEVQYDPHGRLLQANGLDLVLQLVLHAAPSQRRVDEDHCRAKQQKRALLAFSEHASLHPAVDAMQSFLIAVCYFIQMSFYTYINTPVVLC